VPRLTKDVLEEMAFRCRLDVGVDATTHDLQREGCPLGVACTRARDALHVSSDSPSQFLT
jgi:hypothetical protein